MSLPTKIASTFIVGLIGLAIINADPAGDQLSTWASTHNEQLLPVRSDIGSVVPSQTASLTTHPLNGPILLRDTNLIQQLATFNRERIPERIVHAIGAGAHGEFRITNDISAYTKATVFSSIGLTTQVFVRFSTILRETGSSDTATQEPRGFAIKFYTADGNWDLVGISLPVFPIRDPILFPLLQHSRKRNPQTHLPDPTSFWDFNSLRPETTNLVIREMSSLGLPDGFRHMNGFGVHAFRLVNAQNQVHFVKFHLLTQQGIKNLTWAEVVSKSTQDPDYATRDLYNAIATKNYPRWKMYVQIITEEETKEIPGVFDITKEWDENLYPLYPVGELVLNRNPENYFAEVEQVAYDPGNLVPGIEQSRDRMLEGRSFAYGDAQRYRLGTNFNQLPINRPKNVQLRDIHNYNRDGKFCLRGTSAPNYFPNSFGGPSVSSQPHDQEGPPFVVRGKAKRTDSGNIGDNFSQANKFFLSLSEVEKGRLVENVVRTLKLTPKSVQNGMLTNFGNVNPDLKRRMKVALGV